MDQSWRLWTLIAFLILTMAGCSGRTGSPNPTPGEAPTGQPTPVSPQALTATPSGEPTPVDTPANVSPDNSQSEQQIVDIAWDALAPNTSSHSLSNWEVVEVRRVTGQEVAAQFEGKPAPGCWQGPTPPANRKINLSGTYWFVEMKPQPATPLPREGTISPTAPPAIPEPFLRQALFLINVDGHQITARRLFCVIY